MNLVLGIALPLLVVFTMFVVGVSLTRAEFALPAEKMLQQTLIGLLLPVLAGMAVRHFAPNWVARHESILRGLALLAVGLVVAFIITDQITLIRDQLVSLLQTAALFTGVLLAAGWLLGLLAVAAFGRVDIAAFAAVFFLVQVIVLVPLALLLGQARR